KRTLTPGCVRCGGLHPGLFSFLPNGRRTFGCVRLAAGGELLGGVLEAGFGDFGAGDHSGNFVGAGAVVEDADLGFGAAIGLALFYNEMLIGEGGDLREMSDAEDLLAAAEGF